MPAAGETLPAALAAGETLSIFASESSFPSRLLQLDANTGTATSLGSTSFIPGMDFRRNGVLYAAASSLYTVSPTTGAITAVGPLPELIVSIAFSPNDELFALSNDGKTLYKIDPANGRNLGSVPLTGTVFTGSGGVFVGEINGIDFGPDGKLYGIGFALYTIDPATGVATRITPASQYAGNRNLFADMDFSADGQIRTISAGSGENPSELWVIDPTSGIGQLVGSTGAHLSGIASRVETLAAPAITTQPADVVAQTGQRATFSVTATGSPAPTYQWRKDGADIPGATSTLLSLTSVSAASAGTYTVVVSNAAGTVTSRSATLQVTGGAPGRLINLSILSSISGPSDNITVGAVVGGGRAGTKPLLVRAVGPSLTPLGVSGALADPNLEVFTGTTLLGSNNNWGGDAALVSAFNQVGAFQLSSATSLDAAAFLPALTPGNYTFRVTGSANSTGTVLAEIYDATPATQATTDTPRLINVAVLKNIPADGTLTAGFAVGGPGSVQVLIRAVGPTLSVFGLAGTLADPAITLFDASSRVIATNDDWGGGAALSSAFAATAAFSLSASSRDAAILTTLAPGAYTARVNGNSGNSGAVLVEIYEVP